MMSGKSNAHASLTVYDEAALCSTAFKWVSKCRQECVHCSLLSILLERAASILTWWKPYSLLDWDQKDKFLQPYKYLDFITKRLVLPQTFTKIHESLLYFIMIQYAYIIHFIAFYNFLYWEDYNSTVLPCSLPHEIYSIASTNRTLKNFPPMNRLYYQIHGDMVFHIRILKSMVSAWLHEVTVNHNYFADVQLQHFYR